jgi:hypothetical protein
MSQFTTVALTGDRVLVKGTDRFGTEGQTVLDGYAWAEVKRHSAFKDATSTFDSAVEEFFAPLMDAAAQLDEALSVKQPDPDTYVVLEEGVEATAGKQREVIHLDPDSVVLRFIEAGQHDRLVWVMDRLEVMVVEEVPTSDTGVTTEGWDIPEQRATTPEQELDEGFGTSDHEG